jgi:PleD family two-component response regulator
MFLALTSVTVIANTCAIYCAYRILAKLTSKVMEAASDIRKNTEAREWIQSMQIAAERAAAITQSTKQKMAEFDPAFGRVHEKYRHTLVVIDSKLDQAAEKINATSRDVRDIVAKPAFAVATFAAGVTKAIGSVETKE